MVSDYVALNATATIELMKDFLTQHQGVLLVRNYHEFASISAVVALEYARQNLWRWIWLIGETFTKVYPSPLSEIDERDALQLESLNRNRHFRKLEINLERKTLQCQSSGNILTSSFDIFLETSPLAATFS